MAVKRTWYMQRQSVDNKWPTSADIPSWESYDLYLNQLTYENKVFGASNLSEDELTWSEEQIFYNETDAIAFENYYQSHPNTATCIAEEQQYCAAHNMTINTIWDWNYTIPE